MNIPESALDEYLMECTELLQRVSRNLRAMETGQGDADAIDSVYRDIHTIKGSSQLFGFRQIGELTHAMETSMDPIRREKTIPHAELVEALYFCLDTVEKMLASVRAGRAEDFAPSLSAAIPRLIDASLNRAGNGLPTVRDTLVSLEMPAPGAAPVASAAVAIPQTKTPAAPRSTREAGASAAPAETAQVLTSVSPPPAFAASPAPVPAPAPAAAAASAASPAESGESSSTIRVPVSLLDKLMTLMGEMVLVRNQVLQYANRGDDLAFSNLSQRLDVVTSEIQGEVMKTRMQPIGNVLTKFQRVVRDLSKELGKRIELVMTGTETELDKTLLEAIKDPVMHIVRNSCDHGIETPAERRESRKPDTATVAIRAYHEGGQVVVEISDDGRGLNREKLIQKAVEKGLLGADKAKSISDRDAYALIFAPGFSTAERVTNVSGRGVGMDVVKNNIGKIGGIVELDSEAGKGTTIRLKIPLTLAIVPAMIIRSGNEKFAIPQVKLVELVRVEKHTTSPQIELLQGKMVYRLREALLPLAALEAVLGAPEPAHAFATRIPEIANIAVVSADRQVFGLIVDEVLDTADIVVKPLNPFLKSLSIYSGATVLGDGTIALILDVTGIAHRQSIVREGGSANQEKSRLANDQQVKAEEQEFLLVGLNSPTKHAIPLNLVHRLEEFPAAAVEISGGQRLVRYRNAVLPLISLGEKLGLPANASGAAPISVVVVKKTGRLYGVEVTTILDALSTHDAMDDTLSNPIGILGNLVTAGEVIVVVDILKIIADTLPADPDAGDRASEGELAPLAALSGRRILFVEDTVFFKRHVTAVLERLGINVTHAMDGEQAMRLLEQSPRDTFDLILSDIEMPKMNGLALAQAVRAHAEWATVPMVALTTRFDARHVEEGLRAGFDGYIEKLNPEILIGELRRRFAKFGEKRKAS